MRVRSGRGRARTGAGTKDTTEGGGGGGARVRPPVVATTTLLFFSFSSTGEAATYSAVGRTFLTSVLVGLSLPLLNCSTSATGGAGALSAMVVVKVVVG